MPVVIIIALSIFPENDILYRVICRQTPMSPESVSSISKSSKRDSPFLSE